ncbi:hypothetical protein BDW69DRAFT_174883 [Aspergillus filifer]
MAGFLALPPELIGRLFDFADIRSRKTLRLVNSLLSQIGTAFVFRNVEISPTQESWDTIDNIFRRRDLADSVVKVCLDAILPKDDESGDDDKDTLPEEFWCLAVD